MKPTYALSLKQPWATLLIHGLKTIEVRSWTTAVRGRLLIHAARVPDPRPEAWMHLPNDLQEAAQRGGGIIGAADLTGVVVYGTSRLFVADQAHHLNDASWFRPPCLYGFVFSRPRPLPFRSYAGNVRFFTVKEALEK